jgi:hypothetical protein
VQNLYCRMRIRCQGNVFLCDCYLVTALFLLSSPSLHSNCSTRYNIEGTGRGLIMIFYRYLRGGLTSPPSTSYESGKPRVRGSGPVYSLNSILIGYIETRIRLEGYLLLECVTV